MSDTITTSMTERLAKLGLTKAAGEVERQAVLSKKLDIAYTRYRFCSQEKIAEFQDKLRQETYKPGGGLYGNGSYHELTFTALSSYPAVPPAEVLEALEAAHGDGCFDCFEVAQITEQSVPKPDPILFGVVEGCQDRFFIAQWDDDVKIEDILQGDEGFVKEDYA